MSRSRLLAIAGAALLLAGPLALGPATPAGAGVADDLVGNDGNTLVLFASSSPAGTANTVAVQAPAGRTLLGIDTRPSTQVIFGVFQAVDGSLSVGTVNHTTGAVGPLTALTLSGAGTPIVLQQFDAVGIDWNPVADRLRLVTDAGDNLRIDVGTGTTFVDTDLSGVNNGFGVIAVAYTNNTIAVPASTELFDILNFGEGGANLTEQGNAPPGPNGGVLTDVGPLGIGDVIDDAGFEITAAGTAFATLGQINAPAPAGLHARPKGLEVTTRLFTLDVGTGAATLVGLVGSGSTTLDSLTSIPVQLPATTTTTTLATTTSSTVSVAPTSVVLARTGDEETRQGWVGIGLIVAGGAALVAAARLRSRRA